MTACLSSWRTLATKLACARGGLWGRRLGATRARTAWAKSDGPQGNGAQALALWLAAPPALAETMMGWEGFGHAFGKAVSFYGALSQSTGLLDGWWHGSQEGDIVRKVRAVEDAYPSAWTATAGLAMRAAVLDAPTESRALWGKLFAKNPCPPDLAAWLVAHAQDDVALQALDVVAAQCPPRTDGRRDGAPIEDQGLLMGSPRLWCALGSMGVYWDEAALNHMEAALFLSPWRKAGLFKHGGHASLRRARLFAHRTPTQWIQAFAPEDAWSYGPNTDLHARMAGLLLDAGLGTPHMKGALA